MAKYSIYHGEFKCHVCKTEVSTIRHYPEEKQLTWMCSEKHLSEVNLQINRKKKADFA
tara:strand:+ start:762 stop:935 length:174 start_codon:yes stop_codon:yes gene_type:complete